MIMRTKNFTQKGVSLNLLLVVSMMFLILILIYSCAARKSRTTLKQSAQEEEPFVVVEEMPMFPGGDSALIAYIGKNTRYPENAKAKNIQGKVILRFCVTATGSVDRISVLKGVNRDLDAEATRVISTLPSFKPGKQGGKPVAVWYMVPVNFSLEKSHSGTLPPTPPSPQPPSPDSDKNSAPVVKEGVAYKMVDEMPVYPGGDIALLKYLADSTHYPKDAKISGIQGKVITRFMVGEDGTVTDVSVLKGVSASLDNEAVRVVSTLPKFTPGKLKGTNVPVWYAIPIDFKLK